MEVTKYYCELCGREVGYREWTEIVIAVRKYVPHRQDMVSHSKKICIDCTRELGLIEECQKIEPVPPEGPALRSPFDNKIFKNIIKRIVGKKGD